MRQVIDLAKVNRWRLYHAYDSRRSAAGFPDLVLVRPPRLIFAELKTAKGRLTREQGGWLTDLGALALPGVEVYVWRPDDWNEIVERLKRPGLRNQ